MIKDKTVVNSWNEWDPLKHVIVGRADGVCIPAPEPALQPNDATFRRAHAALRRLQGNVLERARVRRPHLWPAHVLQLEALLALWSAVGATIQLVRSELDRADPHTAPREL